MDQKRCKEWNHMKVLMKLHECCRDNSQTLLHHSHMSKVALGKWHPSHFPWNSGRANQSSGGMRIYNMSLFGQILWLGPLSIHISLSLFCILFHVLGYLPPLTKLAAQTEFSQLEKDCSGSSKDGHGLKFER